MKKFVIPVLSLLFIISLDSCKKDSDQPEEEQQPRLLKVSNSRDGNSSVFAYIFEYDESGSDYYNERFFQSNAYCQY